MKEIKVLHLIESLGIGGAESLLLNTVNALGPEFRNIVVFLNPPNLLQDKFKQGTKVICLDYRGKASLLPTVIKLRALIKKLEIDIVHSHLFWPTIIARLACPSSTRLLFSVHSMLSMDAFNVNWKSKFLEKLTYSKRQEALFVSEGARKDYDEHMGIRGKSVVLYNFVNDRYFEHHVDRSPAPANKEGLKLVAVGNLKDAKNYPYLIKAFSQLKDSDITLDIFGEGGDRAEMEALIAQYGIKNIQLKGVDNDLAAKFGQYDLFVLASKHEGFGLAAIEAMAAGLPCMLSDIPVHREVTGENAVFFSLNNEMDFVQKITNILFHQEMLEALKVTSKAWVQQFKKESYVTNITKIYRGDY